MPYGILHPDLLLHIHAATQDEKCPPAKGSVLTKYFTYLT